MWHITDLRILEAVTIVRCLLLTYFSNMTKLAKQLREIIVIEDTTECMCLNNEIAGSWAFARHTGDNQMDQTSNKWCE